MIALEILLEAQFKIKIITVVTVISIMMEAKVMSVLEIIGGPL